MKASDYLSSFLSDNNVKHVFGLQGGAVVHLFDSIEKNEELKITYCHHEQSAALAAAAFAKVSGHLGCVIVTTGPGSTNTLTGLLAAWQDSVPVLFISGQTRVEHTSYGKNVRQVGSQECAILDIVRPITKYCRLVEKIELLPEILNQAVYEALNGRQGPVWIDFPVNLQWENVEVSTNVLQADRIANKSNCISEQTLILLAEELKRSQRPLIIAGNGIRASRSVAEFKNFVENLQLPFVTSWTASDLLPTEHEMNAGIIGVVGQRGANKAVFSSDLIICLGCHLSLTQTGTLVDSYSPDSRKIIIDIDKGQLDNLTIKFDVKIEADLNEFFKKQPYKKFVVKSDVNWLNQIKLFREMNRVKSALYKDELYGDELTVNSNHFNDQLTKSIPTNSHIVVDGGGTALYTGFQSTYLKVDQRIICSSAVSAMGTGLPEAIGVAFASCNRDIYCLIGDGSLMLNIQELQTIYHHKLPIKIIVYNNNGYLAIKHTQQSFLNEKYYGTDPLNGISTPPIERIAQCFDIPFIKVQGLNSVSSSIDQIISKNGPLLVEVCVSQLQPMLFQQGYKQLSNGKFTPADLSEMKPFI